MDYIKPIVELIKVLLASVGLIFVRKSGKDAAEKETLENEIEAIDESKEARDSLNDDKRRKLRDLFR